MARYSDDGLAENSSHVNQKQIRHFSNTTAAVSSKTITVLSVLASLVHMCMRMHSMSGSTVSNTCYFT